jgi:hypothetical protein
LQHPAGLTSYLNASHALFSKLCDGQHNESNWLPYFTGGCGNERGLAMLAGKQDLAPLLALLKMAADQWPSAEIGEVSQIEMFRRDQALLKMWPEACRRVGVEAREFPRAVIRRWQQEMGRGRPN